MRDKAPRGRGFVGTTIKLNHLFMSLGAFLSPRFTGALLMHVVTHARFIQICKKWCVLVWW